MTAVLRIVAAVLLFVAGGAAVALTVPDRTALGIPESAWLGVFVVALLALLFTAHASREPSRPAPPSSGPAPKRVRTRPQVTRERSRPGEGVARPVRSPEPGSTPSPTATRPAPMAHPHPPRVKIDYPPVDPRLVLVLPIQVTGPDPTIEFIADGIGEEILLGLASLEGLRVVPRASAFTFKGADLEPAECARRVGAAHTLTGLLSRTAGVLYLEAFLSTPGSRRELWRRDWSFGPERTCEVEDDLIRAVGVTLQLPLDPGARVLSIGRRTDRAEAQRHYLQARHYWHQRGDGLQKSAVSFEQAIRADTGYALAYAGRADAQMLLGFYGYMEPRTAFQKARESAEKALELDDELAEAWNALGFVRSFFDWDWSRAEVCFRRAVELNPAYMPARYWHAMSRGIGGHLTDWIQHNRTSLKADPLAAHAHAHLGWSLLGARAHQEAEQALDRALELDPAFSLGYWFRGRARLQSGVPEAALQDLREGARRSRGNPITLGTLGYALARFDEQPEALRILEELEAGPDRWRWVRPSQIATVQLGLGRVEVALASLQRGLDERDFWLPLTVRRPEWDEVREESEFRELLSDMELTELGPSDYREAVRSLEPVDDSVEGGVDQERAASGA